jgi:hypothetical protein
MKLIVIPLSSLSSSAVSSFSLSIRWLQCLIAWN